MANKKMAVGDVNSDARGTGARDNEGKPNWSLMLFSHISFLSSDYVAIWKAMGIFQEKPSHFGTSANSDVRSKASRAKD